MTDTAYKPLPVTHSAGYRLWVNDERTVLVRLWDSGQAETASRPTADHTWGPPITLTEEKT